MGFLKRDIVLPGSSLLEAIVASVIFLIVFTICLETTVRLTVRGDGIETYIAMENCLQAALQECLNTPQEPGTKEENLSWGTLTLKVEAYETEVTLQQLTITARSPEARKHIEIRHIIHCPEAEL